MSSDTQYEIALSIGAGKRMAIVSLSSASQVYEQDNSPNEGAVLFVGLQDPYYEAWQP